MPENTESHGTAELTKPVELVYLFIILYAFSWAREFLLPVIFAATLSFLLAPIVSRLEKWGLHRIISVLGVVASAFAIIAILCATLSVEALDLVNSLPKYRDNITAKWQAIQQGPPGPLNLAVRNISALAGDLSKTAGAAGSGDQKSEPAKVQLVEGTAGDLIALIRNGMAPMFGPIAGFIIVIVLVSFMLLEREQLRQRFLQIVGHSQVAVTTLAVDEASVRLGRFLFTQAAINTGFSVVIAIGLSAIGVTNPLLWAALTLVLRFLPYVGLWISALFPLALSIAISTSWTQPILTLLLYVVLEVFTNNVVEPVLLGGSTGLSPLAVIISALFWTWIWGPVGLLLATPITACLVVLGRYFPRFLPYSILLAADPPPSPEKRFLRLLEKDRFSEAKALIQGFAGSQLSIKAADELIIPTIRLIQKRRSAGKIGNSRVSRIYAQMRRLIDHSAVPAPICWRIGNASVPATMKRLTIVPFAQEGDEIVGKVVHRILSTKKIESRVLPWNMPGSQKISQLNGLSSEHILLSATDAESTTAVAEMAKAVHAVLPNAVVLVGLWNLPNTGSAQLMREIQNSSVRAVYTNLKEAIEGIASQLVTSIDTDTSLTEGGSATAA
jgi:predicted PurR-regulated permease PerM/methylmalonyl-CoA mutase cobalamin-binding subunit